MPYRRTTLSKFIIEDQRRSADPHPDLTSLLNDVQTACKLIAVAASRGSLSGTNPAVPRAAGEIEPKASIVQTASAIMVATCEWGGQLASILSGEMTAPYAIPALYPRGRYLLVFDPLDGATNIDVNVPVGTIFSVLRCSDGVETPTAADFLQPGAKQVAAGYALYGPVNMMVITLGAGTNGFTLDPEIGAFMLTHPNVTVPPGGNEFAVNMSNERFWDPPVRRYVEECVDGASGTRGIDFSMRWTASTVSEVHRILLRGGMLMYPRDGQGPDRTGCLRLLYQANPMAMIVKQAGGAASTGRQRILDVAPGELHQRVPALLGSRDEVERLERYHEEYVRGEEPVFKTPLFQTRSLFRTA